MHKPDYYKAPLRSRLAIAEWIFRNTEQRGGFYYNHQIHPFCFNVKLRDLDLSFENLLHKWREYENDPKYTHDDDWLAAAQARYEAIGPERLYAWGVEDTARAYVNHKGQPDDDGTRTLWDGTELDVRYEFVGRSGGWLSIAASEGYRMASQTEPDEWLHVLEVEMPYRTLRNLYQLIVQLKHDLATENVEAEVEHQAAFDFFANACADIPQPEYVQPALRCRTGRSVSRSKLYQEAWR